MKLLRALRFNSDSGQEMYYYFESVGVKNIVLCGMHTNMCILGPTFGIRGQVKLGRNVVLVRHLTNAMYHSEMPPYVFHNAGTALVIRHIEKYWHRVLNGKTFLIKDFIHCANSIHR
ncbi:hypothetical protein [Ulvibacterium sp.]|uniref:hypothetical protein n=1 Tax=Ulvibacterium sp. TaxID=2665914 RepID=UPI003CC6A804